jgi:hypothetical protein
MMAQIASKSRSPQQRIMRTKASSLGISIGAGTICIRIRHPLDTARIAGHVAARDALMPG